MKDRRALAATSLVAATVVALVAWALPKDAAAGRKAPTPACPGGRFVVAEPLITGAGAAVVGAADAFDVGGGQVTLLGGCGPAPARLRPTRKGTRVHATWPECPGLRGRVTMRALILPTCGEVVGTLRAKGYKKSFTATLRAGVCGDGVVDAGEECDPPGENGCDAHCAFASSPAAVCGNGVVEGAEACDDGNTAGCDGCAADCSRPDAVCGDGIVECGEECESDADCAAGQACTGCRCESQDDERCTEPSVCGARSYCTGAPGCLCIRSAEGPIRCGQLPTTCHVQLCETSADCAALGEGWFCDTPNSGCCTDPPRDKKRCIAPCAVTTTTTRPPTTTSTRPPTTTSTRPPTTTVPTSTTTSTTLPSGDVSIVPDLDPAARRLVAEAGKAALGLPADFDGDGQPEFVTTVTGGTVRRESDADGDGNPEYVSTRDAAGNSTVRIDSDSDGRPEVETTTSVGPPPVRVVLRDTNWDGIVDRRETDTFDLAARKVRVVEESDPEGDGTFVTIADDVVPIGQSAGAPCDPDAGLPGVLYRGSPRLNLNDIVIPFDGGHGRCTRAQANRIATALGCAFSHGLECLANTNAGLRTALLDGLVNNDNLMIACGNQCAGSDASTLTGLFWLDATMNVNPDILDGATPVSDADLCTVMVHELLHWRGEGLSDQKAHDEGIDRTYSCGRYCGGCTSRGPSHPGPNVDCARCAGTDVEKARCGLKQKEDEMSCPTYELCHAGLAGDRACQTCRGLQKQFCDDTNADDELQLACCETCPEGFPHNDLVCTGDQSKIGTCGVKPPECP